MNGYVLAANAAVWIFLAAYAASLVVGGRAISKRLQQLESMEISASGLRESHVHDVIITKESPNYRVES